jgi:NTE family protein
MVKHVWIRFLMTHKTFGLVLSGGGARGLAHVGVLRALNHMGLFPSVLVGVSMGAVVSATYALNDEWYDDLVNMDVSGFPAVPDFSSLDWRSRMRSLWVAEHNIQDMYFGWGAGQRTVKWGKSVLKSLTRGKNLEAGRIPVFTCATDLLSGKRVIKSHGSAVEAAYGSSALAGILPPVSDGSYLLADGAYADIAPIDVARQSDVDFVIAVDPAQRDISSKPVNGMQAILRSIEITQNEHAYARFSQADLVINPHFHQTMGTLDFHHKRDCIAAGARAVRKSAPQLRQLLCSPHR